MPRDGLCVFHFLAGDPVQSQVNFYSVDKIAPLSCVCECVCIYITYFPTFILRSIRSNNLLQRTDKLQGQFLCENCCWED